MSMSKILDFGANFIKAATEGSPFRDEKMSQKKEVRKMKKFLGLLLVLGMMSGVSYAVSPTTCILTVTPGVTYSVSVDTENVTRNFGTVNLNSNFAIWLGTATNDGNTTADIEAAGSNTTGANPWTIAGSVALNQYQLQVASGTYGVAATTNTYTDTNVQTEVSNNMRLDAGAKFGLYTKILTPPSSTDATVRSLTLSIYATAQD